MTKERAQYILNNTGAYGSLRWAQRVPEFHGESRFPHNFEDGITLVEYEYIKMIWSLMDDSTSLFNAIEMIAKGI